MRSNWQYMALALVLALLSWHLVTGRESVEVWVEVYVVSTNTPKELVVMDGLQGKLQVRIRGPQGLIRNLRPTELAYMLDMSGLRAGENVLILDGSNIPIPRAITALEIRPARLIIQADTLVEKTLPVRPAAPAELRPGWEIKEVRALPAEVRVKGPRSALDRLRHVEAKPLSLGGEAPEEIEGRTSLRLPENTEADPAQVSVRYVMGPRLVRAWLRAKVQPPEGPDRVSIKPAEVRLDMEFPESLSRNGGISDAVTVRLAPGTDLSPGEREAALAFDLPRWARVIEARPDKVRITVKKGAESDRGVSLFSLHQ